MTVHNPLCVIICDRKDRENRPKSRHTAYSVAII